LSFAHVNLDKDSFIAAIVAYASKHTSSPNSLPVFSLIDF
jgi:hypothetical protein